jgi:hypothetical protein
MLFGAPRLWIVVLLVLTVAIWLGREISIINTPSFPIVDNVLFTSYRRQIIGDSELISLGIRSGWADVFKEEGERFLASFAIPGVHAGIRSTDENQIKKALGRKILPAKEDGLEVRQIKLMVEGMKNELRKFLDDGGSVVEYGEALVSRQEQEIAIYNRVKEDIFAAYKSGVDIGELESLWRRRNSELRKMGIRLVAWPGDENIAD